MVNRAPFRYNRRMRPENPRSVLREIFAAALDAVDPHRAVSAALASPAMPVTDADRRIIVAAFGKAACPMAKAAEDVLGSRIVDGVAITKDHHCPERFIPSRVRVFEASHPVPDERGVRAARELTTLLTAADRSMLALCLVSGGGSALLAAPADGISLAEKQETTRLLLSAGADIAELNAVRKHISSVKGGRLAEAAYPARVLSLLVSDVIGDRLDVIASGPTSPDPTTFRDARHVIEKYGLLSRVPAAVIEHLDRGMQGLIAETPKDGQEIFRNVENRIIASNATALAAARKRAEELGLSIEMLSSTVSGEARDVAKSLAALSLRRTEEKRERPLCLISGGETTVTVTGSGLGGRNTEFALAFGREIDGIDSISLLSVGTDGTDGPTDAAGAFADGSTIGRARALGLDAAAYLEANDSYHFFGRLDDLCTTGPTGTNVMDLQIVLIG